VPAAEVAPVVGLRASVPGEDELLRLRRAVDLSRLIEVGYDPDAHVIRPAPDHPVFGYELCPVAECTSAVECIGLCFSCGHRFRHFRGTLEEFVAIPRVLVHDGRAEERLCLVCRTPGYERPASRRNGLCLACNRARKARGQSAEEYVADALPRPSLGRCARCERWAAYECSLLCQTCHAQWKSAGRPDLARFAPTPVRGARDVSRGLKVDLSALSERPRLEILYAFQETWLDGDYVWDGTRRLQGVINTMTRAGVRSLLEEVQIEGRDRRALYGRLRAPIERLLADPEQELQRDVWRMGILRPDGAGKTLDYTVITQPWLRALVKQWNRERLVSRSVSILRLSVRVAAELSKVLDLRGDRGEDPSALGRQDAVDFLAHLRARLLSGEISNDYHRHCVARVRAMLREARERELHRQPGPLAGLADGFALYDADALRAPVRDPEGEPERALSQAVIDQLLEPAALELLHETVGEALACAIELQMRTGRRPQELAHVPFKCLEHEERMREDGAVELSTCRCSSTGPRSGPRRARSCRSLARRRS
jgi:hypothetical protein